MTEQERLLFLGFLKRDEKTGCLLWTGVRFDSGYGRFRVRGKSMKAHRVAWELAGNGPVPQGFDLMHHCPGGDNKACCEASHLRLGTKEEHGLDRVQKGQIRKSAYGLPAHARREVTGRFQSRIQIRGRRIHLGTFDTAEEASAAAQLRLAEEGA